MNNKAPAFKVLTTGPGREFINKDNKCHRCPDRSWKRAQGGQGQPWDNGFHQGGDYKRLLRGSDSWMVLIN